MQNVSFYVVLFKRRPHQSHRALFFVFVSMRTARQLVSLRLGHTRVLTVHRTVIHFARAASLPPGKVFGLASSWEDGFIYHQWGFVGVRVWRPHPSPRVNWIVIKVRERGRHLLPPEKAWVLGDFLVINRLWCRYNKLKYTLFFTLVGV